MQVLRGCRPLFIACTVGGAARATEALILEITYNDKDTLLQG